MAAAGTSSSGASTADGEEALHLLVVVVDASDAYTHSCSAEDPTQQVMENSIMNLCQLR